MWWMGWVAAASAQGIALDDWVELGTVTRTGVGSGDDEATDVAIDQTGHVIVVGSLSGAAGHGTNGYLVTLENSDLSFLWELEIDAGPVGATVPDSDDRIEAIANPGTNDLAFCGRLGSPAGAAGPLGAYWVVGTQPSTFGIHYPAKDLWSWTLQDGAGSPDQACFDLERAGPYLFAAGATEYDPDGRWLAYRLAAADGKADRTITASDGVASADEQALGIAAGRTTGNFVVVGTMANAEGDLDWHVRFYDADGTLVWTDRIDGAAHGDDVAAAVLYDEVEGIVTVAGSVVDDPKSLEPDWLVVQYSAAGAGKGQAGERWRATIEGGTATSLAADDAGTIVVGGGIEQGGAQVWHAAAFDRKSGSPGATWTGPAYPGDARIQGLHYRDDKLALAGYTHDGDKRRFTVVVLEPDSDGDGVSNSADECPDDPEKVVSGICGCGISDADDRDEDETPDCVDRCPDDPDKSISGGVCGCGVPDVDSDGDAVFDCYDACPDDGNKVEEGLCGCGAADDDADLDGVVDCDDACLGTPVGLDVDASGCTEEENPESCGCETAGSGALPGLLLVVGLLARRRGDSRKRG